MEMLLSQLPPSACRILMVGFEDEPDHPLKELLSNIEHYDAEYQSMAEATTSGSRPSALLFVTFPM